MLHIFPEIWTFWTYGDFTIYVQEEQLVALHNEEGHMLGHHQRRYADSDMSISLTRHQKAFQFYRGETSMSGGTRQMTQQFANS